jgi:MYXO-CTERM domain-containing protein
MPTDVTISLVAGAPGGFARAVNRFYTITSNGGSNYSATVRLRYLAGELGANTESRLHLWRYDGAAWQNQGQSAIDTANKWVEATGVTAFSPWALASSTPTAITLRTLSATSPSSAPASFAGLALLGGLTALVRRRRT